METLKQVADEYLALFDRPSTVKLLFWLNIVYALAYRK